jgi:hypothetical protein
MKDSGSKQQFSTGAQRDSQNGKGRYDLISRSLLHRLAKVMQKGAAKYGDRNWEKGIPVGRSFDSLQRHLWQWSEGFDDEDHLGHAAANLMFIMETEERALAGKLPRELIDLGPNAKPPEKPGPVASLLNLPKGWFAHIEHVSADGVFSAEVSTEPYGVPFYKGRDKNANEALRKAIEEASGSTHWPTHNGPEEGV